MYLFPQRQIHKRFFINVSKDEIKYLDMTFEEASKFIVSAGTSNTK